MRGLQNLDILVAVTTAMAQKAPKMIGEWAKGGDPRSFMITSNHQADEYSSGLLLPVQTAAATRGCKPLRLKPKKERKSVQMFESCVKCIDIVV